MSAARRRWIVLLSLVATTTLTACADKVANQCPNSPAPTCLSGTVCATDPARGCQVCRCETPYYVPESQPPQGSPQPLPQ
jgi:hypothetical protein